MCDCKWLPIETAPKDGSMILAWCGSEHGSGPQPQARIVGWGHANWVSIPGAYVTRPTHWMPMPAPPGSPTAEET